MHAESRRHEPARQPLTEEPRAWLSWSSGKDSTFALHVMRVAAEIDVVGLLTTVNSTTNRVAMHAVRPALLEAQAQSLGLPLYVVELPSPCPDGVYERQMTAALTVATEAEVSHMVFGDLFLADVRAYRERMLAHTSVAPLFPLWGRPTDALAREMIDVGVRGVITCVDPTQAPASLAGRWYDHDLLRDLPDGVDPCGERGEFHTFVVDGPGFDYPLDVTVGEIVQRDGFVVADVVPAGGSTP